ncbi:ATP-binding protein [Bacillus horneckiae]|uniref:ATP-binding protein n=1 Tax=Cytobacillus eiseniae TaxID=762947 RepID=UPI00083773B0
MVEGIIIIQDNGVGFEPEFVKGNQMKGIGLFSIRERAEGLGGEAIIETNLNQGTLIHVRIPQKDSF